MTVPEEIADSNRDLQQVPAGLRQRCNAAGMFAAVTDVKLEGGDQAPA
jgi:hypothetical protein